MCGLTGFFAGNKAGAKRSVLHDIARQMEGALRHRGPDAGGVWIDENAGLALAHRRLAIIDLSEEGAQPMASSTGRYVIIFNGEIYNYLPLRAELENAGAQFRGRSDTEVLLELIEARGLNQTLQQINGMFAFVLWDKKTRQLHFARDRFGKKPLYIGWAGKSLVFGSELKALRAHPDFEARINEDARALYMNHGYVPAPFSIYKNVWSLPAGHRLSLNTEPFLPGENLSEVMEAYWNPLEVLENVRAHPAQTSESETVADFETLLSECVRDRMISDVPLGAFLSGGIDSSAVVALMQKNSVRPVQTFTIGFEENGFDEAAHAAKIAAHLGTDHHELYLDSMQALEVIPALPEIYDEPFADISAIPTYLVSKFAREYVTVALSGDGGDEMLGGYTRYAAGPAIMRKAGWMPAPMRKFAARAMQGISPERWDRAFPSRPQIGAKIHKAASILALSSEEEIYHRLVSNSDEAALVGDQHAALFFSGPEWRPKNLSFADKMMYWDVLSWLPNDILVKVDRASMAASLEARAPLLDRRVFEYAWRLPENMRIRGGKGKWILRELLKKHVPEQLFERPKQGFNMPVAEWLRGPLRDWAESLLGEHDLAASGLEPAKIRGLWAAHLKGEGSHAARLWTVLSYQAWQARWG